MWRELATLSNSLAKAIKMKQYATPMKQTYKTNVCMVSVGDRMDITPDSTEATFVTVTSIVNRLGGLRAIVGRSDEGDTYERLFAPGVYITKESKR